jgi:hypothetical protein
MRLIEGKEKLMIMKGSSEVIKRERDKEGNDKALKWKKLLKENRKI